MSDARFAAADRPNLPEWKALLRARSGAVLPCAGGMEQGTEWFADDPREQARAAALCRACAVRQACASYALAADERHGVWGGLTELDRKRLRREQRRAA